MESVQLRPRVSGYIATVNFVEGALVKAGEPLFTIDDRAFKAELNRAQAQLSAANSDLSLARSNYQRAQHLALEQAISREIVDNRKASFLQAQANVKAAKAELDLAELNVEYTQVTAPIDGRVSRALTTQGNYVSAGRDVLTSIVSIDKTYAYFDADEQTYLKYVELDRQGTRVSSRQTKTPVYMALVADDDYSHQGYIDFVDNQVDPATGTIRGRAVFDNTNQQFIPGLFARIRLVGSASYQGILIDNKAIGTDLSNKFVLVLDEQNVVQYRPVILGEKIAGLRIIKSGLSPTDTIVVNGLQRVRPGTRVVPQRVAMTSEKTLAALRAMQKRVDQLMNRPQLAKQADHNSTITLSADVVVSDAVVGG